MALLRLSEWRDKANGLYFGLLPIGLQICLRISFRVGCTDDEISAILDKSVDTIRKWRKSYEYENDTR